MHPKKELALFILQEHFGDIVARVGKLLLESLNVSFEDILDKFRKTYNNQYTQEDEEKQVRDTLLVLLQHNLATFLPPPSNQTFDPSFFLDTKDKDKVFVIQKDYLYRIEMNNILLRIRFPHYAEEIRSKYDERCAQIFELFCIYGKISQEQVLNQLAQISDFPMVYGEDLETFDPHDSSKKSFAQLVKGKYIYKLNSEDEVELISRNNNKNTPPKKTATKSPKTPAKTSTKAKAKTTTPSKASPKTTAKATAKKSTKTTAKSKKKKDEDEIMEEDSNNNNNIDVISDTLDPLLERDLHSIWYINIPQFISSEKQDACEKLIEEKINPTAGIVARALMKLNAQTSRRGVLLEENYFSVEQISAHLEEKFDHKIIRQYLELMTSDKVTMALKSASGTYAIHIRSMIETTKEKTVESILFEKFGTAGMRIFRILLDKRQVEQTNIADIGLLPQTTVRNCLYSMLSKGFVKLQEVPRSAEYEPARTFYLWTLDIDHIYDSAKKEIFATIKRLKQRLYHEVKERRLLMLKIDELQKNNAGENFFDRLSNLEKMELKKFTNIEETLQTSILRLSSTLNILEFF